MQGGEVHAVGPLNIAYRDGESSTVYVKFSTPEDSEYCAREDEGKSVC